MRTCRSFGRHPSGYSLIEVIVSVVVLSVLLAAFYAFYRNQAFALLRQHVEVDTKESAEIGLDYMIREIRMAGARPIPNVYPPGGCTIPAFSPTPSGGCPAFHGVAGFPWITAASTTAISFQYDHRGATAGSNADGCPDDLNERIAYAYDAANERVTRAADGGAALTVVDNVPAGGFQLLYHSRTGTQLTPSPNLTTAQINDVATITLTVRSQNPDPHPNVPGGIGLTQSTTIYMRNPPC